MLARKAAVATAFVAWLSLASPVSAAALDASLPLRVVDSQGVVVGKWADGAVYLVVSNVLVAVPLGVGAETTMLSWFGGTAEKVLYYPTPDCSGPGYSNIPVVQGTYPVAFVNGENGPQLFIADNAATGNNFEFRAKSVLESKDKCKPTRGDFQMIWRYSSPAVSLSAYRLPFTIQ